MAAIHKLNVSTLRGLRTGRHSDGGGLYLNVTKSGSRSWVYVWKGKRWATPNNKTGRREMGLGKYPDISLAIARTIAASYCQKVSNGIDPKVARDAERNKDTPKTFGEVAHSYINNQEPKWKNAKHIAQWRSSVDNYAKVIKGKLVAEIELDHILTVFEPLWHNRPETARRVLGRIERILNYATVKKYRSGDNPAQWKLIREVVEAKPKQELQVKHHAALDYKKIPDFIDQVQKWDVAAASALYILILTAMRTSEVLNARWEEFDLEERIWIVPAERMKRSKPHAVPLPDKAVESLRKLFDCRTSEIVFGGQKQHKPLSSMAMLMLLRRKNIKGITVHGFRSTFRDWANDVTNFDSKICEQALAHSNPDKVEASYLRSTSYQKRRQLMQAWCDFCHGKHSADVIYFSSAKNGR